MKGSYYTNMELQQLNIIQSVIDRKRTGKEAASALKISERQIWRKVKSVKENGRLSQGFGCPVNTHGRAEGVHIRNLMAHNHNPVSGTDKLL